jgi:hypothetical protein
MARTSCDSAYHCRDGYPCQSCRSVLECPAPKMCDLSTEDQYVCQSNHGIAEAVTGVLGGAQFSSGPFYHPSSSRGRFGHPREAAVGAGNFPDSHGISDDFKRQKRSHHTEPVPQCGHHIMAGRIWRSLRIVSRVVSRRSRSASNSFSDIDADQVWCNISIISGNHVRCASPEAIGILVNTFMQVVHAVSPHASPSSAPEDCTGASPWLSSSLALRMAQTTGSMRSKRYRAWR